MTILLWNLVWFHNKQKTPWRGGGGGGGGEVGESFKAFCLFFSIPKVRS